jgi:hypothetical protein
MVQQRLTLYVPEMRFNERTDSYPSHKGILYWLWRFPTEAFEEGNDNEFVFFPTPVDFFLQKKV